MGEEYPSTQVSCHVEAKVWIGLGLGFLAMKQWAEVWINGLFVRRRSIIPPSSFLGFAAPVVLWSPFRLFDP